MSLKMFMWLKKSVQLKVHGAVAQCFTPQCSEKKHKSVSVTILSWIALLFCHGLLYLYEDTEVNF